MAQTPQCLLLCFTTSRKTKKYHQFRPLLTPIDTPHWGKLQLYRRHKNPTNPKTSKIRHFIVGAKLLFWHVNTTGVECLIVLSPAKPQKYYFKYYCILSPTETFNCVLTMTMTYKNASTTRTLAHFHYTQQQSNSGLQLCDQLACNLVNPST